MKKELILKIASIIIGVLIFILLVYFGFRIFGTRAADLEPRDVVVSNISTNSVTVSWVTGQETQGVIEYGTTPTALNFFAPEPQKAKNHTVDLTLLSPSTTYYFQIRIGDKKYDNGGVPWTFTTKAVEKTVPAQPSPTPTGQVVSTPSPTPIQSLKVDSPSSNVCNETDCQKIKEKLGKGCTTQDYFKCIMKLTPTTSAASASPTLTPTTTP
ncbi:MAG: fibronectin type III domain-containing protein, partial [Microgenomates group bacterium]